MRAERVVRACAALMLASFALGHPTEAAAFADVTVINGDAPGEGFNDPTPVAPVPGNSATTLGAQRLFAFEHAVAIWAQQLDSPVPIQVQATMDPLLCDSNGAVLGTAGPSTLASDWGPTAPAPATWYPIALANALAGVDLDPGQPEIIAQFSSVYGVGTCFADTGFYYGTDGNPGVQRDFITVVLHELGHGFGFAAFWDATTGAEAAGQDDVFSTQVELHGAVPSAVHLMSDAQRRQAAVGGSALQFVGPRTVQEAACALDTGIADGHPRLYAPASVMPGSSVSHFDPSMSPNELMEPFYTTANHDPGLAVWALRDIGYTPSALAEQNACTAQLAIPVPVFGDRESRLWWLLGLLPLGLCAARFRGRQRG